MDADSANKTDEIATAGRCIGIRQRIKALIMDASNASPLPVRQEAITKLESIVSSRTNRRSYDWLVDVATAMHLPNALRVSATTKAFASRPFTSSIFVNLVRNPSIPNEARISIANELIARSWSDVLPGIAREKDLPSELRARAAKKFLDSCYGRRDISGIISSYDLIGVKETAKEMLLKICSEANGPLTGYSFCTEDEIRNFVTQLHQKKMYTRKIGRAIISAVQSWPELGANKTNAFLFFASGQNLPVSFRKMAADALIRIHKDEDECYSLLMEAESLHDTSEGVRLGKAGVRILAKHGDLSGLKEAAHNELLPEDVRAAAKTQLKNMVINLVISFGSADPSFDSEMRAKYIDTVSRAKPATHASLAKAKLR